MTPDDRKVDEKEEKIVGKLDGDRLTITAADECSALDDSDIQILKTYVGRAPKNVNRLLTWRYHRGKGHTQLSSRRLTKISKTFRSASTRNWV